MSLSLRILCAMLLLFCICGSLQAKEHNNLDKPNYKIIYDEIDFTLDARVVVILNKTNDHYCVYLIDVFDHQFKHLSAKEALSVGQPLDYDTAKRIVDLQKLGLSQYGF